MCPYTLDHKQDARIHYATLNTQPHPTPTSPPPHKNPEQETRALGRPGQEWSENNTQQVSPQDPTVCELAAGIHQHVRTSSRSVPPSHTHTTPTTIGALLDQAWNQ
jgi:hypothetical protein